MFGDLGRVVCTGFLVDLGKVEIAGVEMRGVVEGGVGPDILAVELALVGVETLPVWLVAVLDTPVVEDWLV